MKFQKNIILKNYTTFRIGGKAKYFFIAKTKKELILAVNLAKEKNLPFFILGGGSNLLISDKGYDGLIIKIQDTRHKVQDTKITAEAGAILGGLVGVSVKNNLTGLEWAVGIPGTIQGAVYNNTTAFKKSIKETIKEVEVFNIKDEKVKIFQNKDCKFKYKDSIFQQNKNLIILSIVIKLKKGNKKDIQKKIKEYLAHRRERQPNFPSAGCVFKNYQGKIKNQKLLEKFPELKEFNKKQIIPVGWLIEKSSLKGKKIGNVEISKKHCNFIVNLGGGKARDVIKLINLAKKEIKSKFEVFIEEEIQYLS